MRVLCQHPSRAGTCASPSIGFGSSHPFIDLNRSVAVWLNLSVEHTCGSSQLMPAVVMPVVPNYLCVRSHYGG
jgi:hypothetical protein